MKAALRLAFFFTVTLLAVSSVAATTYKIVELPSLGSKGAEARVINNQNQIAGRYDDQAVVWDSLGIHSLGTGIVWDINEKGELAGSIGDHAAYWDENGTSHVLTAIPGRSVARTLNNNGICAGSISNSLNDGYGFIWDESGWQQLPAYGQSASWITSINDSGVASGYGYGDAQPLRWNGMRWESLPSLGGSNRTTHISESGVIVGESNGCAVFWDSAGIQVIGAIPGYTRTYAKCINEHDIIVGGTVYAGSYGRGWLWDGSAMQALDPLPGDEFSEANYVNDNGWIVGMSGKYGGNTRAVVWMPESVPEPSTMLVMLSSIVCLAPMVRRRR